jgi:ABC-type iron transport system FetAB permease component
MTITLLIIAYVLTVFLNRVLNKIICKRDRRRKPHVILWFLSIIVTIPFLVDVISLQDSNWFTGKYWK